MKQMTMDEYDRIAAEQMDAMLEVACIKCGARPGDGCRSVNDKTARPHAARWWDCALAGTVRRSPLTM